MKAHIGVDAGTGYVHTVTATAANVHDLDQAANLVRDDDEVVYADAGYQGADRRPDFTGDGGRSKTTWRVAARRAGSRRWPHRTGPRNHARRRCGRRWSINS